MNLSALLTLADSRLPIGGHVHSGGAEEAVTSGVVHDIATVEAYLLRRIRSSGAVAGSIAAAVASDLLDPSAADCEADARTPSPAARAASRAQGRGLLRLAKHTWREHDWSSVGLRPHLAVVSGVVAKVTGLGPRETAMVQIYTAMTGSAIATQRLLALDPADVAACTFGLTVECDLVAESVVARLPDLADLSDPLLDFLGEKHLERERPLFVS